MHESEHSKPGRFAPPAQIVNAAGIPDVELQQFDDGPRARDIDIAKALGFVRPRDIRQLIERNLSEIEGFGLALCRTAPIRSGKGRVTEVKEYWLNEEQALLIASISDAERAPEVRRMLIRVFVAWRRGDLPPHPANVAVPHNVQVSVAREARLQYKMFRSVARDIGLKGNQAVLSANRATKLTTGFDVMGALGITHIDAVVNEPDLIPSSIALRLGVSGAKEVNRLLCRLDYQTAHRDHKDRIYYELTPKGESAGGVYKDTGKRHESGVPVKQLHWPASIVDRLRGEMERGLLI